MHGPTHSRLQRLLAATLAAALPWLGCVPNPPMSAIAGVPQAQQVHHVAVPGGLVNAAGGNLFVRRVDLSIDTVLGTHEIAAVYNAASGEWLWNFQMAYNGAFFRDPTGVLFPAPPAGRAFPGSVWVKVDEDTVKTKGGRAYHFDPAGKLAYIAWATLDYPRLVFSTAGIDQCVAAEVCSPLFAFSLNPGGQPLSVTDARTGRVASFGYDGLGRLVSARSALDTDEGRPGFHYEYSSGGTLLTAIINSEGERVEYTYQGERRILFVTQIGAGDPRHRFDFYGYSLESRSWAAVHTNPLGGQTRYDFDDQRRVRWITREATGEVTWFAYEAGVRPFLVKTPDGAFTGFRYVDDDPETITEASGNLVTIVYEPDGIDFDDPLARPIRRIDDSVGPLVERDFDASGRIVAVSNGEQETSTFGYTGVLRDSVTGPAGVGATFPLFGVHGHWLDAEGPLSDHRAFDPVGNLLVASVVGERGGILARRFDSDRNVGAFDLAATNDLGEITATGTVSITRRSDGRPTTVARVGGGDHAVDYDALGRPVALRERVDGVWQSSTFAYDAAGNLIARERANGMREEFDRDAYGRVIAHRAMRGGTLEGEALTTYANGNKASHSDSIRGGVQSHVYDTAGRPAVSTYGHGETLTTEYDLRSRVVRERFDVPGLGTVADIEYAHDLANRRVAVVDRLAGTPLMMRAFQDGRLVATSTGNGLVRTRDYDPNTGKLVSTTTADSNGNTLEATDIAYTVEANPPRQQIHTVMDTALAVTEEEYWLGLPGALVSEEGRVGKRVFGWSDGSEAAEAFAYDELGNRTSDSSGNAFVYNGEGNRLLAATLVGDDPIAYGYDEAGFVTSRAGTPITWTATGRLASHGKNILTWDLDGRLVSATISGVTRTFGWFGGRVQGDPAASTLGALEIENVVLDLGGGSPLYRHLDFRRNVSFVSDGEGAIVEHYRYGPYGLDESFGAGGDSVTFAGRPEIGGLMLLGARVYDPAVGRFLSLDPILNAINQFAYTLGNPIGYADPQGLMSEAAIEVAVAAAGMAVAVVGLLTLGATASVGAAVAAGAGLAVAGMGIALAIEGAVNDTGASEARPAGSGADIGSVGVDLNITACGLLGIESIPLAAWLWFRRRRPGVLQTSGGTI